MIFLFFPLLAFALEGTFVQGCRQSVVRAEQFDGGRVTFRESNFSDSNCAVAISRMESKGSYELGSILHVPDGAREIDFVFSAVLFTVLSDQILELYRERKLCGFSDWEVGQAKNITGLACEFFSGWQTKIPGSGEPRYGIIKIESDRIQLGALSPEENGLFPWRRPKVLDPLPYLRFER